MKAQQTSALHTESCQIFSYSTWNGPSTANVTEVFLQMNSDLIKEAMFHGTTGAKLCTN